MGEDPVTPAIAKEPTTNQTAHTQLSADSTNILGNPANIRQAPYRLEELFHRIQPKLSNCRLINKWLMISAIKFKSSLLYNINSWCDWSQCTMDVVIKVFSTILIFSDIGMSIVFPGGIAYIYHLINCHRKMSWTGLNFHILSLSVLSHFRNFLDISQDLILFRNHNLPSIDILL